MQKFNLRKTPTEIKAKYRSEKEYEKILAHHREKLATLQELLYADRNYSILIVLQGMDTAGKDGAIKHIMSGVNPQGCHVASFKEPSTEELDHDFMWRITRQLPARGMIGIFNRSYYEDVLVPRVHRHVLMNQRIPKKIIDSKNFWKDRYKDIVHYEKYLSRQGTHIIKFFIHISKEEQKKRLLARFDSPKKLWKISESDVHERRFWNQYQEAYEHCLKETHSDNAPWYVIPGDDKKNARILMSEVIVNSLESLKLHFPRVDKEQKKSLAKLKKLLEKTG